MPERAMLLGNGFSIAYGPQFEYDTLLNHAALDVQLRALFDRLGTTNFEEVMRRLFEARRVANNYAGTDDLCQALLDDSYDIRTALIRTLRDLHPHSLTGPQKVSAAAFLSTYSRIFTLNYDLLLYWASVPRLFGTHDDGFRGYPKPIWTGENDEQSVFYLHGGVHLIDQGATVEKLKYDEGRFASILDQLDERLDNDELPMFVSEGTAQQKLGAIKHNAYLSDCYETLRANELPLTIYGFSFNACDAHIVNAIAESDAPSLEVFIYPQADPQHQYEIAAAAEVLRKRMEWHQERSIDLETPATTDVTIW